MQALSSVSIIADDTEDARRQRSEAAMLAVREAIRSGDPQALLYGGAILGQQSGERSLRGYALMLVACSAGVECREGGRGSLVPACRAGTGACMGWQRS
ncbi:MAG TPA: hypothetical protein VJ011_07810 [Steroidobacteraceae bacterium]|nr:hypothetical protein [Steroidobacteraceae bacterium]